MSSEPATSSSAAPPPQEKPNPFAALGSSGAQFGSAGGFSFGVPGAVAPKPEAEEEGGDGEDEAAPEEECQAEFKPVVQLDEVETSTGEEDEDALLELKCKLYRYDGASNEWKERGLGVVKMLQHKENKKVRLLMRQDKTLKIRANHIVMPGVKLQEHAGNDKAWVWSTVDFAEEAQKVELFAVRFGSVEKAQEFKAKFEEAQEINGKLITAPAVAKDTERQDADDLAKSLEEKAKTRDDKAESKEPEASPKKE
mmetsp:Transcript_11006/g.30181  ORF Transcript_11006/g.30181 Transcript_11006/m.30181 type:complete len:254 (-) Transcript_11006:383-1144(-)|eukprot:CAMPEP_0202364946 /NCGR_PEP_ID=MMETSP1126-20121109/16151_1 /ASSEMBLY_ACC=CAM_ASM_000457 /TAXON_ID=3047 /ORGANISM="Dunaliella tertiolecta, Strain CCMP1320" /LENGTH=253 /DNA_ID=CAMNT_0048959691 /DNA_START=54 /DNA_END=815 /DNA_ORIENTATION=+